MAKLGKTQANKMDERIEKVHNKIFAYTGFIILIIAFLDIAVRAVILQRPFMEWVMSAVLVIIYLLVSCIWMLVTGTLSQDLESKEQIKVKMKESIYETLPIALAGVIFLCTKNGLPETFVQWSGLIIGTVVMIGIMSFIDLFMLKLTWKFMNKSE